MDSVHIQGQQQIQTESGQQALTIQELEHLLWFSWLKAKAQPVSEETDGRAVSKNWTGTRSKNASVWNACFNNNYWQIGRCMYRLTDVPCGTSMHAGISVATTWYATASSNGWWSGCTTRTPHWTRSTAAVRQFTRGRSSMTCCHILLTASQQVSRYWVWPQQRYSDSDVHQWFPPPPFSHSRFLPVLLVICHIHTMSCFFRVCLLSVGEVWVHFSGGLHLWYGSVCCVCPAICWDVQLPGMGSRWDDL